MSYKSARLIREYVIRVAASVEEVRFIDPTDQCLIVFSGPQLIVETVKFINTSSGEVHVSYNNRTAIFTKPVVEQVFFISACSSQLREVFELGYESMEDLETATGSFMELIYKKEWQYA